MMNTSSVVAIIALAGLMFFCVVVKVADQTRVRGSGISTNRALNEAGIAFSEGYIVNGEPATASEVPWFVHFGDGICGGSLISGNRVLTAAHCVRSAPRSVRIGATNQNDGTSVGVRCANRHPNYDGFVGNDVAVLKLDASVDTATIGLNTNSGIPAANEELTVIGLGRTRTNGPVSQTLQQIKQNYVSPADCSRSYGGDIDGTRHLCALTSNKGVCNGDSGGPMFDASFNQVGIVSFGSSSGCNSGVPDGYTRVSSYIDWINEQIASDDCDGFNLWGLIFFWCNCVRDTAVNAARAIWRGEVQ